MEKKKILTENEEYKQKVNEMLTRRNIKNRVATLVWLRSQKQLKVAANMRRVMNGEEEMKVLEEMIESEDARISKGNNECGIISGGLKGEEAALDGGGGVINDES